ncbi:hypothetical protein BGPG180_16190 [Staphylococcus epidermidis]|nr:hypothetical protein KUHPSE03_21870 [Staphylococcus epidermidis]
MPNLYICAKIKLCIIPKENSKNPQILFIVFIDYFININMLIDLKSDYTNTYYIPAIMYQINNSSGYNRTKRTRITNIEWEDY